MFKKILIANRGEIAVRVIRACREMGIPSVAVYSDVDRAALHVRKADEAYPIGSAAAAESYLNIDKILEVAKRSGADAIHPGYGFLSENAKFAQACADAGIKFIGPTRGIDGNDGIEDPRPPADGKGRRTVCAGHVARTGLAQRSQGGRGEHRLSRHAEGCGRRRRQGHAPGAVAQELKSALESAQSEAQRAFGDGEVYLEKAIVNPRHIEMQVLADEHGNTVYLGERECSIQRRHQKVIEEAPSPVVDPDMRRRMGEVAVRVAQARSTPTPARSSFWSMQEKNFYFLEMNTRLQVEHPVTELVTGLDLVHLQIRIAAGEKLPFSAGGYSYARPRHRVPHLRRRSRQQFLPQPGEDHGAADARGAGHPRGQRHVRGLDRAHRLRSAARQVDRLWRRPPTGDCTAARALDEYFVAGIKTNLSLFRRILGDADFQAGKLDTGYLDRLLVAKAGSEDVGAEKSIAAIAAAVFSVLDSSASPAGSRPGPAESAWKRTSRAEGLT